MHGLYNSTHQVFLWGSSRRLPALCLILLMLGCWTAGCAPVRREAASPATAAVFAEVLPVQTNTVTSPAITGVPFDTIPATEISTQRELIQATRQSGIKLGAEAQAMSAITATQTTAATEPAISPMCSPLVSASLKELPKIISAPYDYPPPGNEGFHHGVDFSFFHWKEYATIDSTPVQSVFDGVVAVSVENSDPYGNFVIIETPVSMLPVGLREYLRLPADSSLYLAYVHMKEKPLVKLGEHVLACQVVGKVGKTGMANVAHLHFETRVGPPGRSFAEMSYYNPEATPLEKKNYLEWRISKVFRHFDPMLLLTYRHQP